MFIIGLLLASILVFVLACLLIAARRGLWLKVELDATVHEHRTTSVVHHHAHHHLVRHEVAHSHQVAHHHHLHTDTTVAEPVQLKRQTGFLSRAVLPRTPVQHRLIQHIADSKETQ